MMSISLLNRSKMDCRASRASYNENIETSNYVLHSIAKIWKKRNKQFVKGTSGEKQYCWIVGDI